MDIVLKDKDGGVFPDSSTTAGLIFYPYLEPPTSLTERNITLEKFNEEMTLKSRIT